MGEIFFKDSDSDENIYVSKLPPKNPHIHTMLNVRIMVSTILSVMVYSMMPKAVAAIIENATTNAEIKMFPQCTSSISEDMTADIPMPANTTDATDANLARYSFNSLTPETVYLFLILVNEGLPNR